MMWKEFEQIAGYEVAYEDYHDYIEPMYMAVGDDVTKQEFVRMIDKKRFAIPSSDKLLREVRKEARHLFAICGFRSDYQSEMRMDRAAKEYALRKYGIDWENDKDAYVYFQNEYQYPGMRGCSYPVKMIIGRIGGFRTEVKLQRN